MTTMKIHIAMHYEFKLKNSAADAARNIIRAYSKNTVCKRTYNVVIKHIIPGMNLSKTNRAVGQHL